MNGALHVAYTNATVMLFAAWWVYAFCQEEFVLPLVAGVVVIMHFIFKAGRPVPEKPQPDKLTFPRLLVLSLLTGTIWRVFAPGAIHASSLLPLLTAGAQSATLIAAVMIYRKPMSRDNLFLLYLLAWLTVAISLNVSFKGPMLFITGFFCMIATGCLILHTMHRPLEKRHLFVYYRDFILFSALLILVATGLTIGLSRSIAILDNTLMDFISDYVLPRGYSNFLTLDPQLTLASPGFSAVDKRPVLEVSVPQDWFRYHMVYLKLQVFKDFDNGRWKESPRQELKRLPSAISPDLPRGKMTLFTPLDDIIPAVAKMTEIQGPGTFRISRDNLVYADRRQNLRVLEFTFNTVRPPVHLTEREMEQYTSLPADIAPALRRIAGSIAGKETDQRTAALMIRQFFRENFKYTLDVNYKADNRGLIRMIRERRPAYCSYFATASALLMRAQGIPARVVTGFMTTEKIEGKDHTFLVRVRNAHAWAEGLWPETDRETGQVKMTWHLIDSTPGGVAAPLPTGDTAQAMLERFLEKSWIQLLRLRAWLGGIDQDSLKMIAITILLIILAVFQIKRIWGRWIKTRRPSRRKKDPVPPELKDLMALYGRYETFLQKQLGETRRDADTDRDVLTRLRKRPEIPPATLEMIARFLRRYQAARFGKEYTPDLEKALREVEQSSRILPNRRKL